MATSQPPLFFLSTTVIGIKHAEKSDYGAAAGAHRTLFWSEFKNQSSKKRRANLFKNNLSPLIVSLTESDFMNEFVCWLISATLDLLFGSRVAACREFDMT